MEPPCKDILDITVRSMDRPFPPRSIDPSAMGLAWPMEQIRHLGHLAGKPRPLRHSGLAGFKSGSPGAASASGKLLAATSLRHVSPGRPPVTRQSSNDISISSRLRVDDSAFLHLPTSGPTRSFDTCVPGLFRRLGDPKINTSFECRRVGVYPRPESPHIPEHRPSITGPDEFPGP